MMPLAFAPVGYYLLAFPLLALALWLWLRLPQRAFLRGWLFGLGQFGIGVHWIYFSLHDFGGAAPPFAAFSTLSLVAYLALYPGLCAWLVTNLGVKMPTITALGLFPALWTLSEWLREHLLTGFPWLALGYSQIDSPLAGWAPLGGIMATSFVTALTAGALLELIVGVRRTRLTAAALVIIVVTAGVVAARVDWSNPHGGSMSVALVQGNIAQDLKWSEAWRNKTLERYLGLTVEAPPVDLVVWPETALPAYLRHLQSFTARLVEVIAARGGQVLTGAPTQDPESGAYHNSLVLLGPGGGAYHKVHLVPFGEYLPLRWLFEFFETYVRIPMADFSSGPANQDLLQVAGSTAHLSICYEVIFANQMRNAAQGAGLLINVSNDAWFGDSLAPHQHLEMARMRALELGRQMARATNNGISAVIDTKGRVVSRTQQFQSAVLTGDVQPYDGETPFSRFGYWPALVLSLLIVAGVARRRFLGRQRGA